MQSLDEDDDWDTDEHRSYEPAVKGVYMGYEMGSCCGDGSLSIPQRFLDRNPGRFQSVILSMNVESRVLVYPVAEWLTLQRRIFDAWSRPGMQRLRQLMRGSEELLLVAPDEEHFEELELRVAARRLAADGDADEIRGLVVQTVGHVEVGFGERIPLVEVDRGLAADRVVRGYMLGRGTGGRRSAAKARPLMRPGFFDEERAFRRRGAHGTHR